MPFAKNMGQNYEEHSTNIMPVHPHDDAWKQGVLPHSIAKEAAAWRAPDACVHTLGGAGPAVWVQSCP